MLDTPAVRSLQLRTIHLTRFVFYFKNTIFLVMMRSYKLRIATYFAQLVVTHFAQLAYIDNIEHLKSFVKF